MTLSTKANLAASPVDLTAPQKAAMRGYLDVQNTAEVASAIDAKVATAVASVYTSKGDLSASGNPNYPAATKVGELYYVTVAGRVGGASGKKVDVGDQVISKAANAGGTEASVGTNWYVAEHNLIDPLLAANNLSELPDKAAARTNLVVPSTTELTAAVDSVTAATDGKLDNKLDKNSDLPQAYITHIEQLFAAKDLYYRDRLNHFNDDPADNSMMSDGTGSVEENIIALRNAVGGVNPDAPQMTNAPTFTGTAVVNGTNFLEYTAGAVTEGVGGVHKNSWQAYTVDPIEGTKPIETAVLSEVSQATKFQLNMVASLLGKRVFVRAFPKDSSGIVGPGKPSALSAVISAAVQPANTAAPSISPGGSQPVATARVVSFGTWTGMSGGTFEIQVRDSGQPFGEPITGISAALTSYSWTGGQANVGHNIDFVMTGISALGVRSAAVPTSNVVSVSGSPTVSATVAPAFSTHLYLERQDTFSVATWTGAPISAPKWDITFEDGTPVRVGNTLPQFTPKAADGASLTTAGKTKVKIREYVTEISTGIVFEVFSALKTIEATPANLVVTQNYASLSYVQGSTINSIRPIDASGGVSPLTYSKSATPGSMSYTSAGVLSGSAGNTLVNAVDVTFTVTDATGAIVSVTIPISVTSSAPSVVPLDPLPYPVYTTLQPNSSPTFTPGQTLTGSSSVPSNVRMQSQANVVDMRVTRHRIVKAEWNGNSVRSEKLWIDMNKYLFPGNDYTFAFAIKPLSTEWPLNGNNSDDAFIPIQFHSESNGDTQPPISMNCLQGGASREWYTSGSAASQAQTKQFDNHFPMANLVMNQWNRCVLGYRPGYLASHQPRVRIFEALGTGNTTYTKVVDSTALVDYNWNTGSYPRIGFYKWDGTNWINGNSLCADFTDLFFIQGSLDTYYDRAVESLRKLP